MRAKARKRTQNQHHLDRHNNLSDVDDETDGEDETEEVEGLNPAEVKQFDLMNPEEYNQLAQKGPQSKGVVASTQVQTRMVQKMDSNMTNTLSQGIT